MKLVLVRHGESVWNKENRFTGWTDVDLSENGITEAHEAGKSLKEFKFDIAFTSVLKRANKTLDIILDEINQKDILIKYSYKLNERHYGALQGLNKDETRKKYGDEQVHIWRRSYDVKPPALEINDERYPGNDIKYKLLTKDQLPLSESLKDTLKRTIEYYNSDIIQYLKNNKNVLVVAHGNSIRAIIKHIEKISDEEIMKVEIPTGIPYVYEFDNDLNIISKYFIEE